MVASVTLILGAGNFELLIGGFNLGGIGTATFAAIALNVLFSLKDKN
jgi:xanthine/uracil permease